MQVAGPRPRFARRQTIVNRLCQKTGSRFVGPLLVRWIGAKELIRAGFDSLRACQDIAVHDFG